MRNRPEKEEDRQPTQHGTCGVGHQSSTLGASAEVGDDVVDQHIEGGSRGVPDLELVVTSDELRAVPQACRRADREQIGEGSDDEDHPPQEVICSVKLLPIHIYPY